MRAKSTEVVILSPVPNRIKEAIKAVCTWFLITDFLPANTIFNKKIFGEALKNKNFLEIAMVCRTALKR